jgi:hypothetical protein
MSSPYPAVTGIEIVPFQPREVDRLYLASLSRRRSTPLPPVAYLVKIAFEQPFRFGADGLDVFVGDEAIRRGYGMFPGGIFLLVHDPDFLRRHGGDAIAFTTDGVTRHDTGARLPNQAVDARPASNAAAQPLPSFDDAVKGDAPRGGSAGGVS